MSKKERENRIEKRLKEMQGKEGYNKGQMVSSLFENTIKNSDKSIINIPTDKLYPSPDDINFFPPISEEKMLEMVFSILDNGLFNPIIVWAKENNDKYMILAGHNRVEAYKRIIEEYEGSEDFNKAKYESIPAIIYTANEINLDKAKEIVIDTNYIQRKEDKRLAPVIIKNRLEIVRNRKDNKGRTIDIVADEMGLSKTKVYEDYVLAQQIIPEISELYFTGKLNKKLVLKFNWYSIDMQKWIYSEFKDRINNETMTRVRRGMDKSKLAKAFLDEAKEKLTSVSFTVPESLRDELREYVEKWIKRMV